MTDTIQDLASPATEFEEAQALVAALEQRVVDGDESVTSDELATAREQAASLSRFAKLRQHAAVRREQAERAATRSAVVAEARALVDPIIAVGGHRPDGGPAAEAAKAKVVEALTELRAMLESNQGTFAAASRRLTQDDGLDLDGPAVDGVRVDGWGLHIDGARYSLPSGSEITQILRDTAQAAAREAAR